MRSIKYIALGVVLCMIIGCKSSHRYPESSSRYTGSPTLKSKSMYNYPGSSGDISEYENFIRYNPMHGRVSEARQIILRSVASGIPWDEIQRTMANLNDIDGARYDEDNDRLVIWGPESDSGRFIAIPPLLLDDFAVALTVLKAGQNPGVSIGTISGRVPTQQDIEQVMRTKQLPVEYIPLSTFNTHMGSVLFEIDRSLKGLAHGEDNLTRQEIHSSVPGYLPVSRRLQQDDTWEPGRPRPLGLWWFVPDETGLAFEGYTIKFVRYRMRVEYRALTSDPAVAAFGEHMSRHFEDFAQEFPPFRELVRLHKLVQVARWFQESGFPMDDFQRSYHRINIKTPETTKMIQTLASSKRIPGPRAGSYYIQQSFLIGGVDLSPRNYYIPAPSLPPSTLTPGTITQWQSHEYRSLQRYLSPPRYGTFKTVPAPVPTYLNPIFQSRPSPMAYGWTAKVNGFPYAVVSIPMRRTSAR